MVWCCKRTYYQILSTCENGTHVTIVFIAAGVGRVENEPALESIAEVWGEVLYHQLLFQPLSPCVRVFS